MPQLNKGGKFVFGKSLIREGGEVCFPPMAVSEYDIAFTMGAKGPLMERTAGYDSEIPVY